MAGGTAATKCKKGEIERTGYTAQRGRQHPHNVTVAAKCIPDRGLPGKTPESRKIPFMNAAFVTDDLGKHGYTDIVHKNAETRRVALGRAIREYGSVPVLRKVNVIDILNRNTNPKVATRLENDKKWIEKTYHTNQRRRVA